jgi:hypothetical protein
MGMLEMQSRFIKRLTAGFGEGWDVFLYFVIKLSMAQQYVISCIARTLGRYVLIPFERAITKLNHSWLDGEPLVKYTIWIILLLELLQPRQA